MAGRGVDNEAQKFLGILRDQKLPQALPEEPNITRFQVDWSGKEGELSPSTPARLIARAISIPIRSYRLRAKAVFCLLFKYMYMY